MSMCVLKIAALGTQVLLVVNSFKLHLTALNNKHLMTGPEGNSEFCFPKISMFPETMSMETLRLKFQRSRATAVNISRVTVNCFPGNSELFPV